jgi:hypothetical protein
MTCRRVSSSAACQRLSNSTFAAEISISAVQDAVQTASECALAPYFTWSNSISLESLRGHSSLLSEEVGIFFQDLPSRRRDLPLVLKLRFG